VRFAYSLRFRLLAAVFVSLMGRTCLLFMRHLCWFTSISMSMTATRRKCCSYGSVEMVEAPAPYQRSIPFGCHVEIGTDDEAAVSKILSHVTSALTSSAACITATGVVAAAQKL
jgi:hypothetical protein